MHLAQDVWRSQSSKKSTPAAKEESSTTPLAAKLSPAPHRALPTHTTTSSGGVTATAPPPLHHPQPPHSYSMYEQPFMHPMMLSGGYSPSMSGRPPMTPGFGYGMSYPHRRPVSSSAPMPRTLGSYDVTSDSKEIPGKRSATEITPTASHVRAVRLSFDPVISRAKRVRAGNIELENVHSYFGPKVPPQPKIAALNIFSFLSDKDIRGVAIVCKTWNQLSKDEQHWNFSRRSSSESHQ